MVRIESSSTLQRPVPIGRSVYSKCAKRWPSGKANPVSRRPWFSKKQSFGSSVRNRLIEKPAEGVDHNTACFPPGGRGSETTFSTRRGRKHRYPVVWLDTFGEDTADTVQLILIPTGLVASAPLAVATGAGLDIGSTF